MYNLIDSLRVHGVSNLRAQSWSESAPRTAAKRSLGFDGYTRNLAWSLFSCRVVCVTPLLCRAAGQAQCVHEVGEAYCGDQSGEGEISQPARNCLHQTGLRKRN